MNSTIKAAAALPGRAGLSWRTRSVIILLVAAATLLPSANAQTAMSTILAKYTNYDLAQPTPDGIFEISSLTPTPGVEGNPDTIAHDVPLTLVFVEPRLLNTIFAGS